MAHVVDTRSSGGSFVVLGESLTLPSSSSTVTTGVIPGSLRYNPGTQFVETFLAIGGGDPAWTPPSLFFAAFSPTTTSAGASPMKIGLIYEPTTSFPLYSEGSVWANEPYSYFGISKAFDSTVGGAEPSVFGGGNGPVTSLFLYANNTGSLSDVTGVMASSVARVNNTSVIGANFLARTGSSITGARLIGLKVDVRPSPTGSVASGSGISINAFNQAMPLPAIVINGNSGSFSDGIDIGGVRNAGIGATVGATMASFINTTNGTYSDAAIVLGYQQRIHLNNNDGTSGYISADAGFLHLIAPTNGYQFHNSFDTTLMTLASGGLTINVPLSGVVTFQSQPIIPGFATTAALTLATGLNSKASDPTSTDIPAAHSAIFKNTGSGIVKLWVNDGGTLKSVTLS